MVAPIRRSARAASLLLCILLTLPAIPGAGAQATVPNAPSPNLATSIHQGELQTIVGSVATRFINGNEGFAFQIPVYNSGLGGAPKGTVPVYVWLENASVSNLNTLASGWCFAVDKDIPAATAGQTVSVVATSLPVPFPSNIPPGAYKLGVTINVDPRTLADNSAAGVNFNCNGLTPTETEGTGSSGHVAQGFVVKDFKPDYRITSLIWCRNGPGDQTASATTETCTPAIQNNDIYAHTYSSHDPNDQPPGPHLSYFLVTLVASGYSDTTDYGGPCAGAAQSTGSRCANVPNHRDAFDFQFDVRATGNTTPSGGTDISTHWTRASDNSVDQPYEHPYFDGAGVLHARVGALNLLDAYGNYTINISIDPDNVLRENNRANNFYDYKAYVYYSDLVGNFTAGQFATDPTNPITTSLVDLDAGTFTIRNLGTYTMSAKYQWYLDTPDNPCHGEHLVNGQSQPDAFAPWDGRTYSPIHLTTATGNACHGLQTTTPGATGYLSPGTHKLVLITDWHLTDTAYQNATTESNESNNNQTIIFYVKDSNPPTFTGTPGIFLPSDLTATTPSAHPYEKITVRQIIHDEAQNDINATANFTLDGHPEVPPRLYHIPANTSSQQGSFETNITDFGFATNGTSENWTLRIMAVDAFNNTNVTKPSDVAHLRLDRWPIQLMNASLIWNHTQQPTTPTNVVADDNPSFSYGSSSPLYVVIDKMWTSNTGVPDQANVSSNIGITIFPAHPTDGNKTFYGKGIWHTDWKCAEPPSGGGPSIPDVSTSSGAQAPPPCTDAKAKANQPSDYGVWATSGLLRSWGGPGLWNITVMVNDTSGQTRYLNHSFRLEDAFPTITDKTMYDTADHSTVASNASDTLHVHAAVSDDAADNGAGPTAYLNFTRINDGVFGGNVTIPLANRSNDHANDTATLRFFTWDWDVKTGRGTLLGVGGTFKVRLDVVDENGNWVNNTLADSFTITDAAAPILLNATVDPQAQETKAPVTFTLKATDETNITGRLTVRKGGVAVVGPIDLAADPATDQSTAGGYSTFSYTTNFSNEGDYDWEFKAVDSIGHVSPNPLVGRIKIRDNLGPRFEIHGPAFSANGERYGGPAPRIELLAYDSDTVDASSVRLLIDGEAVTPQVTPSAAGDIQGLVISYQWPPSRPFAHGEVVTVNVSALDNGDKHLEGDLNFTFTVDAQAPTARLVSFDPHYPGFDARPWNVSLQTRFALAGDDPTNGGPTTGIAAIKFKIAGGGANNVETVYTGPFNISSVAGAYTGPKVYIISFWAEDGVGNVNKNAVNSTISVFVDDSPPSLSREIFPQGRYINASFVDDRVGVQKVVLWHRVNDGPWLPLAMTPPVVTDGEWAGVLPEGRKGDHIAWYVQAWDNLNNTDTVGSEASPAGIYSVDNHAPVLLLTSPVVGEKLQRAFYVKWAATDADNDPLVFGVYLRQPGKTQFTEIAKLESPDVRQYLIDSSGYADGEYTVQVTASDGQYVEVSQATVSFQNRASAIGPVQSDTKTTQPGQKVLITAQITKAQAQVEAHVSVDGKFVGTYPMHDDGKDGDVAAADGTYSALVPIDSAGDYSVEIFTQYSEDGKVQTASAPGPTFSSTLTSGYVLSQYSVYLVLVGVLAIAAVGVAVFFVARRR